MKILFIIGSLAGGGAERVVSELATNMSDTNDVYIMMIASSKVEYNISNNIKLIDCSKRLSIPGINFIKRIIAMKRAIKDINPNICISFTVSVNIYAILACLGIKTKLIVAERNDPRFDPSSKILRILRRILYPFANNYVFQTNGEKEFFSKKIQKKSVVIPNPVNPNLPNPYIGKREKRFVTAVRLVPQKNLTLAIDAFERVVKKYPEYMFEIYGEGPLKEELQNYIEKKCLKKNILLKGRSNDLYNDINSASGFILSSNYEGISNSMIEAMALGIPTISTDYPSGGARENIEDHRNGILIPVNDLDALIHGITELICNDDLASKISKESIKLKDKLDIKIITSIWKEYIESSIL